MKTAIPIRLASGIFARLHASPAPKVNIRGIAYICCALLGAGLAGCESLGIEAWERESLSKPEMQFLKHDIDLALDDHFYFSKEGSSGGRGFAGGGCGCN